MVQRPDRLTDEDRAYLEALAAGEDPALPIARRSKPQRAIHAKNLTRR